MEQANLPRPGAGGPGSAVAAARSIQHRRDPPFRCESFSLVAGSVRHSGQARRRPLSLPHVTVAGAWRHRAETPSWRLSGDHRHQTASRTPDHRRPAGSADQADAANGFVLDGFPRTSPRPKPWRRCWTAWAAHRRRAARTWIRRADEASWGADLRGLRAVYNVYANPRPSKASATVRRRVSAGRRLRETISNGCASSRARRRRSSTTSSCTASCAVFREAVGRVFEQIAGSSTPPPHRDRDEPCSRRRAVAAALPSLTGTAPRQKAAAKMSPDGTRRRPGRRPRRRRCGLQAGCRGGCGGEEAVRQGCDTARRRVQAGCRPAAAAKAPVPQRPRRRREPAPGPRAEEAAARPRREEAAVGRVQRRSRTARSKQLRRRQRPTRRQAGRRRRRPRRRPRRSAPKKPSKKVPREVLAQAAAQGPAKKAREAAPKKPVARRPKPGRSAKKSDPAALSRRAARLLARDGHRLDQPGPCGSSGAVDVAATATSCGTSREDCRDGDSRPGRRSRRLHRTRRARGIVAVTRFTPCPSAR